MADQKLRLVHVSRTSKKTTSGDWTKKRQQLGEIEKGLRMWETMKFGPRSLLAVYMAIAAIALFATAIYLLGRYDIFVVRGGVQVGISVALWFGTIFLVHRASTLPLTYSDKLDRQLTAYDPVSVMDYRVLQDQVRQHGLNPNLVEVWLALEYQALATAAGWKTGTVPSSSFLNRRV